MKQIDIVRAWKDETYRASLSDAERSALPAHPSGTVELDDSETDLVGGGMKPFPLTEINHCPTFMYNEPKCGGM
jgi:mersacidin/lichenicidin family type 2 lantibiotic